jgi:hypothetical protein
MNGRLLEKEVEKFLESLEKLSMLSAAGLNSFLHYARRFLVQMGICIEGKSESV